MGKIQSKSDMEEWFWVCSEDNIADMDTRPNVTPEQMKPGSRYQEGNRWMQEDAETWPIEQKFGYVPTEELLSKGKVFAAEAAQDTRLVDVSRFSSLQKLLNTVVLVFKAKARFQKFDVLYPSSLLLKAEKFLFFEAQASLRTAIKGGEFISLRLREVEVDAGCPKQLIVIAGCLEN